MKENNKTYCRKCIRSQSTQIRGTSYSRREGDEGFGSCSRSTDLSQTDWSSFYKRAPPRTTRLSVVALRVVRLDILCDSLPSWFLIPLEVDVWIPDRFQTEHGRRNSERIRKLQTSATRVRLNCSNCSFFEVHRSPQSSLYEHIASLLIFSMIPRMP